MSYLKKIKQSFFSEYSFFLASPALVWQALFVLVPLALIAFISFIDISQGIDQLRITASYYATSFNITHLTIIFWSCVLAFITALSCFLVAYPIAYYVALRVTLFKNVLLFFLVLPFWTNLLVLIYSWMFILETNGILNRVLLSLHFISKPLPILNSMLAVWLVMFYCYLPFMVMPIFSVLEKLDPTLLEASADLGSRPTQTFWRVILPLSMPGVRTGFFLVFVPAFGEFAIPLLMGGDKYMFVGNAISHYVFTTLNFSQGASFTMVSLCVLLAIIGIIGWLMQRLVNVR